MKILILGAGGTGGYFGGRLHQGGADVTFLVREARAQHIATHGLMLESPKDKVTLQVKTVQVGQVKPSTTWSSCRARPMTWPAASRPSHRPWASVLACCPCSTAYHTSPRWTPPLASSA